MQHNDETLGTREIVSASDPAPDDRTAASGNRSASTDLPTPGSDAPVATSDAPVATSDGPTATDAATRPAADESGSASGNAATPRFGDAGPPAGTEAAGSASTSDGAQPLLAAEQSTTFRRGWEEIQAQFVDHPRGAVQEADRLVAALMKQLAEDFAREREQLEAQWDSGNDISTEDLRVALQRYRSFFQRLLST